MELKRKIYDKLLEWKEKYSKDYALMIEGARRIGKSTIVESFAKNNYKSYVIIDFAIASDDIKKNFSNLNKLDIFFQNISLEYNVELFKNETLIIFDEVQKFPKAREAIKYLVKDGRYSYIETGSLISIKEGSSTSKVNNGPLVKFSNALGHIIPLKILNLSSAFIFFS